MLIFHEMILFERVLGLILESMFNEKDKNFQCQDKQ